MEILGIGLPEIVFVLLIALLLMGTKDLEKAGRTIGGWLRRLVTSREWTLLKDAGRQIGLLPYKLMREAQDLEPPVTPEKKPAGRPVPPAGDGLSAWTGDPPPAPEPSIAPPRADADRPQDQGTE